MTTEKKEREAGTAPTTSFDPVYYGPCAKCGESHGGWESCDRLKRIEIRLGEMQRDLAQNATWQDDTGALLEAVGLSDHARPVSCHAVIRDEILPAIAKLRGDLEAANRHVTILREQLAKYGPPVPPKPKSRDFA